MRTAGLVVVAALAVSVSAGALVVATSYTEDEWAAAGHTKRTWLVVMLAAVLLSFSWLPGLAFLVAVWPALRRARAERETASSEATRRPAPVTTAASGAPPLGTGVLALRRRDDGVLGRLRIEVDGAEVAALRRRATACVPLRAGEHELRVRRGWTRSPPTWVCVPADGETRVEVGARLQQGTFEEMLRPGDAFEVAVVPRFSRW